MPGCMVGLRVRKSNGRIDVVVKGPSPSVIVYVLCSSAHLFVHNSAGDIDVETQPRRKKEALENVFHQRCCD